MAEQDFLSDVIASTVMSRRSFVKWSAALGGSAAVLASGGLPLGGVRPTPIASAAGEEEVKWNACVVNCGSRCPLRLVVRDGVVVRVKPDNTGEDEFGHHQVRACVRGRSVRQRIYNPDRLKYPMRRVGARGEGKFEQITWEEAFDAIANKLKELIDTYGNEVHLPQLRDRNPGRGGRQVLAAQRDRHRAADELLRWVSESLRRLQRRADRSPGCPTRLANLG